MEVSPSQGAGTVAFLWLTQVPASLLWQLPWTGGEQALWLAAVQQMQSWSPFVSLQHWSRGNCLDLGIRDSQSLAHAVVIASVHEMVCHS